MDIVPTPPDALQPPRAFGVLVADDEPEIRDVVEVALGRAGFAVWIAVDGKQAVELFRGNHARIDAALLDVDMPHLNGPQALAAFQEIVPQIPCCFMSGGFGAHIADELSQQGALGFLRKPFPLNAVIRTVRNLVRAGESSTRVDAHRRNLVASHSLQLDVRDTHSFGTAGHSGTGKPRNARGP